MNRAKLEHKSSPAVKVTLTEKEIHRIVVGPLKATGGKGRASWVRQLILKALEDFESKGQQ